MVGDEIKLVGLKYVDCNIGFLVEQIVIVIGGYDFDLDLMFVLMDVGNDFG